MKKAVPLFTISICGLSSLGGFGTPALHAQQENPPTAIVPDVALTQAQQDSILSVRMADSLASRYDTLEELVVEAKIPTLTTDGATLTYNVDEDASSKGSTVLDMLRRVPLVTVDGEDNIKLKGESGYKLYVNGREEPSLSANAGLILKSMPAEAVSKIEVITEPGAKYDAEGSTGIINLVTIRTQKQHGYSGSITGGISNRQGYLSGNFLAKQGNVTASANLTYAGSLVRNDNTSNQEIYDFNNPSNYLQRSTLKQRIGYGFLNGSLNLSWEPSKNDLLAVNFNFNNLDGGTPKSDPIHETNAMFDSDGNTVWKFNRNVDAKVKMYSNTAMASWQHNFDDYGQNLVLSYQFSYGDNRTDLASDYYDLVDINLPNWYEFSSNRTFAREHTAQLDYTNPFKEGKHTFETGFKGIWRPNSSAGESLAGNNASDAKPDEAMNTRLHQEVDIYAAYVSYTGKYGNFTTKAGVRYEHTEMSLNDRLNTVYNYRSALNDVVPNAALSYNFNPATSLRLAYQMRISRPTINQVNPFEQIYSSRQVRVGNPDLDSERSNNVSATFSKFTSTIGGSIGVEYTNRSNAITEVTYYKDGLQYVSYANLGRSNRWSANGMLVWPIIKGMRLNISGTVSYLSLNAPSMQLKASGWEGNYSANWSYNLPQNWDLNAYGGQTVRSITLQGYNTGYHYYGFSVSKAFLADKSLRVTLQTSNFLEKNQTYTNMSMAEGRQSISKFTNSNWSVGCSVTWKFGHLNSSVKNTSANLDYNDAVQSGSSKGSGIGL